MCLRQKVIKGLSQKKKYSSDKVKKNLGYSNVYVKKVTQMFKSKRYSSV